MEGSVFGLEGSWPINRRIDRLLIGFILGILFYCRVSAQDVKLPPKVPSGLPFTEAIHRRMSVREFQRRRVESEKISWILWAVGQCRMDGKFGGNVLMRMEGQDFLYDSEKHALTPTTIQVPELRMYEAPVQIYLLPKGPEYDEGNDSLWLWRGMAGQAIYLGASALGLGTVTVGGIGFPVGYASEEINFQPDLVPGGSNLPPWQSIPQVTLDEVVSPFNEGRDDAGLFNKEVLSQLLWVAYGYSRYREEGGRVHRTVPSSRGRYPMDVFGISADSVFRYNPEKHRIEEKEVKRMLSEEWDVFWMREARQLFVIVWDSTGFRNRNPALYEAGAMTYNLRSMANGLGLVSHWILVREEEKVRELIGLESDEPGTPILIFGVEGTLLNESEFGALNDGTYVGESLDWPEMKVEVTVLHGRISEVKVLENNGSSEFSDSVIVKLPALIIAEGSTDVDGVSGATMSSNSLKVAVEAALKNANVK
jgi:uncharacterized protein with FMN-binding domain